MKPGGVLVVNYPDIGSWIARALGRRWLFLTSVHLHYFDRGTMTRFLESAGFEVLAIRPHFQRLELDYILSRGAVLSKQLVAVARGIAKPLGSRRSQVPYWLGPDLRRRQAQGVGQPLRKRANVRMAMNQSFGPIFLPSSRLRG